MKNNLQLQWKKTIGTLTIILCALRLTVCIPSLFLVGILGGIAEIASEGSTEIGCTATMLFGETFLLGGLLILGIILLCLHRGTTNTMPRPKARGVTDCILLSLIFFYILELIPYLLGIARFSISTVFSFGYFIPLMVFSILGLVSKPKDQAAATIPSSPISQTTPTYPLTQPYPTTPISPYNDEIEALKKKIELHKLEKELMQINAEKQAELEKLKKTFDTMD